MPKMEIRSEFPRLDKFDFGFNLAHDIDFVKPEVSSFKFFDEVKADWKDIEKFEFKHMDVEKSFKQLLKKI